MCKITISTFEFMRLFPTDDDARAWLECERWGDKPRCPRCTKSRSITARSGKRAGYYHCGYCRKEFTVRTGSVMECSRLPIKKWLYAMYLMATSRKGVSSLQLSKEIGITQKSAWFMLQRIREACRSDGQMLKGVVEIDETYIGGIEENKHASKKNPRHWEDKSMVLGMRERGGRVRAMPIKKADSETITEILHATIERPGTICTDEAAVYGDVGGYQRFTVNHSAKQYVDGMACTNGIESVWALLKRAHYGTHHHFSKKHLKRYVDECSFRLNEGNVERHTMDRIAALCAQSIGKRLTYKELTL